MTAFLYAVSDDAVKATSTPCSAKRPSLRRVYRYHRGGRVRGGCGESYQVMTLSAIGDAETPAGGSVCMRFTIVSTALLRKTISKCSFMCYT